MGKLHVLDFAVYRWRYSLGYIGIAVIFIALLVLAGLFIPGGISSQEMSSVVSSDIISVKNFTPEMVINLPYYLLQKSGFYFFGVSNFTIKLPTIIFASFSAFGMILLLKTWFKQNVTVLTALVAMTTGPFLLAAQAGTPGILYIFWPIWLLLAASMISRRANPRLFWKILFFVVIALSLYTPLSIYVLLALASSIILHPHLRHIVRNLSKLKVAGAILIALILLIPMFYGLYQQPSSALNLLGIPSSFPVLANLEQLAHQYLDFFHPTNGIIMTPVYELAAILLVILGGYRIATTKHTARSYVLVAWLILLIPVLIISPGLVNVTFVPFLLLMGYGIDFLIKSWYRLFPKNPYARVAGLIPLVIFISSLTLSGIDRFVYGYLYNPSAGAAYSQDLTLLSREFVPTIKDKEVVTLQVSRAQEDFYRAVGRYNPEWRIQTITTQPVKSYSGILVVSHDAKSASQTNAPVTIVTGADHDNADRFYVYKSSQK